MAAEDDQTDLEASILERESELEKLEKEEDADQDQDEGEEEGSAEEDEEGDKEQDAGGNEEPDEDEEGDEEEDNGDDEPENHAKARVDKKREETRIEQLENEIRELKAAQRQQPAQQQTTQPKEEKLTPENAKTFEEFKKAKGIEDPEPNKAEDYEGWLEWKGRQADLKDEWHDTRMSRMEQSSQQREESEQQARELREAQQELGGYIQNLLKEKDDGAEVLDHLEDSIKNSIRLLNPRWNATQVQQAANYQILQLAGTYYNKGVDPAVGLYELGLEQGYTPKQKTDNEQPQKKTSAADNLKNIARNKKKSGSPLGKGGKSSSSRITFDDYNEMPLSERMNLSNEELAQIEEDLE